MTDNALRQGGRVTGVPSETLSAAFVEVADTLVDDFDLIEFLQMVTTHTSEVVRASTVGLLLADRQGRLQLMAATDERTQTLELFQVQAMEGPCQDCYRTGQAVIVGDLQQAARQWPRFAPRAVDSGFLSVHAFPMRLRGEVIGALNIFSDTTGTLSAQVAQIVQALADVATIGLLQERAIRRGEVLADQLQSALNTRVVIEQAKGALSQIHGIGTDAAFDLLRQYSRNHSSKLSAVAGAVLHDPETVSDLTQPQ